VFLRWLFTTFPQEMRHGWAWIRPDLLLWLGLAALLAVATMAMPPPGGEEAPPVLPFFVGVVSALVSTMLPAVLFTAQLEGRQLTWGPVLLLMARKAAPLIAYAIIGYSLAWIAQTAMILSVNYALGDSVMVIPLSTVAGIVILVSVLVRFSFLPFVVILLERDNVPPPLWQWQRAAALAPIFWPLTTSARMTDGNRWRLAFYTLLQQVLPFTALLVPETVVIPVSVVVLLVLTMVQGVMFDHYRRICDERGVPPPSLPLEQAIVV
jgi:hypothetical protein